MWVFTNNAMISVVSHRTKPGHFMVRARLKGDLERVFPGVKVSRTPAADYLFRCVVSKAELDGALQAITEEIDYPNFKGSVSQPKRLDAYHQVWDAMMDAQLRASPGTGGWCGVGRAREVDRQRALDLA